VEHVAQMMRSAEALATAYHHLNRDLLLAGVLFHDCGKLWENAYLADGFVMPYEERGELLGHITIGIELVNRLWREAADSPASATWADLRPTTEEVRLHLLHLIASHHGELAFGSPVVPKTPEAVVLHHVDNIDAKLEMFAEGYATSASLAKNVFERRRPLTGNLVRPLDSVAGAEALESSTDLK
jgi:3'-5' exoribonuclease